MHIFMKIKTQLAIALTLLLAHASMAKATDDVNAALDELLKPWGSDTEPGVAVAIFSGDELITRHVGLAQLEYAAPIGADTVFHVASLSKQVTAFAVLMLLDEGLIALDDEVKKYLPELRMNAPVKIRHLLDHTSGIRERWTLMGMAGWLNGDVRTDAQVLRLLRLQTGTNFAPGAAYEYSNSNYFLLSQIIQRVTQKSLQEFTTERIFKPLGMQHTMFYDDITRPIKNRAYSYAKAGGAFVKANLNMAHVGATGLQTTASDLMKWGKNFSTHAVGSKAVFDAMRQRTNAENNAPAVHARGQELRPYRGHETWSHGGRDAGYRAFLLRVPDQDLVVAVLANRDDVEPAGLAFAVADLMMQGAEPVPEAWNAATTDELQRCVGSYELFDGLIFDITADDEKLYFAQHGSNDKAVLHQVGPRTFMFNPQSSLSVRFSDNGTGASDSLFWVIGLNGELRAPRINLPAFDATHVDLSAYVGAYYSAEIMTRYELVEIDGRLHAQHVRLNPIRLTAYQADTFSTASANFRKVQFVRDENDAITGFLASGALANRVVFEKVAW